MHDVCDERFQIPNTNELPPRRHPTEKQQNSRTAEQQKGRTAEK